MQTTSFTHHAICTPFSAGKPCGAEIVLRVAMACCLTLFLAGFVLAEEGKRPSWDPVREGVDLSRDSSVASDSAVEVAEEPATELTEAEERREMVARIRSKRRQRVPVSEASMGSEGEVIVEGSPEYPIQYGEMSPSYFPPGESISFDAGTVCPMPTACEEPRERCWFGAEFPLWWSKGHYLPPLVTTGTVASLGVLRDPDTEILYGAEGVNAGANWGLRFDTGWWFAPKWALEADILWLGELTADYFVSSTGDPLLARPFTNVVTGAEDSHLVALPGTLSGALSISSTQRFRGLEFLLRRTIHSGTEYRFGADNPITCRWDVLAGYRYNQLNEDLLINEGFETAGQTTISLYDLFDTNNDFHGVDMGLNALFRHNRWSLEFTGKMALGNVRSRVFIDGATVTTAGGVVDNDLGGMLALTTNMGTYTQNQMAVIPELGVTLGFDLMQRCRVTFGYTFIYWSNVARPADQIDKNLNPTYFPNNGPAAGAAQPEFVFMTSDFWTQGLNLGLEMHF